MLTQIDVNSENAFFVKILGVTPKDSLLVRTVTGLDPPDLNLFIGDYARDGGNYQGRRVGNRNVVLTMDLNPNPAYSETISGLREMLYKAFLDPLVEADYIRLGLHLDDGRLLYVVGYTEKIDSEIFSIDTMAQVSIVCPDPYLRDQVPTLLTNASGWLTVPFTYHGTAETGFEAEIYITAPTSTLTLDNNSLTNDPTNDRYYRGRMILNTPLVSGDVVYVNTTRGSRALLKASASSITPDRAAMSVSDRWASLTKAELTSPLINTLTTTSPWLELHSQSNTMKVYGASPSDSPAAIKTLKYTQAYWGI